MSFHYPRRVKDLPTLESESEDDFNTPQKPLRIFEKAYTSRQSNKENEGYNNTMTAHSMNGSSGQANTAFSSMQMYPKRSSELPALESESDDDDDEHSKNDRLNCAILNDSFIMSPGRSEQDESSTSLRNSHEYSARKAKKDDNLSFVLRFDKMALQSEKKSPNAPAVHTLAPSVQKPTANTSVCHLRTIQENSAVDHTNAAAAERKESEAVASDSTTAAAATANTNANTTTTATATTTAEAQFATPQVRTFSVQRRPRDLCSTQSQKTRSAIVNEFRSQKVLFQTPMAVSRTPISCLPNDSISLSLCDTMNDIGGTPSTAEKPPPPPPHLAERDANAKFKKSLEGAFSEAQQSEDKEDKAQNQHKDKNVPQDAGGGGSAAASTNATASASTGGKETVLRINNADYRILKKLGCGGSSSVYLAHRNDTGQECALKVVDLQGDPAVVEGYLNETKLLAKLQGNICVVALYEYQLMQKESKLYLVMEKGDSDLHKILQTYTTSLPLYVLMNFLYQMLQAVNYIHQNGVIHSDLKPANFLMVSGRLKLIDFGIASNIAIDSTSIIKFSQAGTFNYISPEALTDTSTGTSPMRANQPKIKISTKSDVWSLGCILYLLLYKKTPFSHIKNIYAKISAISSPTPAIDYPPIPPYYPPMLVHMVKNCLQHNPKKRPSCAELLQYPFNMVIPIQSLAVPTRQV